VELITDFFNVVGTALWDFVAGWGLPDWAVVLIMATVTTLVLFFTAVIILLTINWLERKIVGRFQERYGPNRVGPLGLLQPIADVIKMFTKEDITPKQADRLTYNLAPILILVGTMLIYAVIPFGKGLIGSDVNIGVLYLVAAASLNTIAVLLAGWSSRNKFSLLGGFRGAAQLISYEVPMVLSMLVVVMLAGSMSTGQIVAAQSGWFGLKWFGLYPVIGWVAFLTYFIAGVAEANRSPFDLPEAESEIVAGFHTEYSGMKFALFLLAEYVGSFGISAIAATLFLGGWNGPFVDQVPVLSLFYFLAKSYALLWVMMWLRSTLPRVRIDQLQGFAWKVLLPVTLLNVFVTGAAITAYQSFFR